MFAQARASNGKVGRERAHSDLGVIASKGIAFDGIGRSRLSWEVSF
jgi:hypothetical protein